jgi:hypothetical protein
VSGKQYLANGGQQDMEEFMTVILTELLEKEFKDDDEIFSSTFTQFWVSVLNLDYHKL